MYGEIYGDSEYSRKLCQFARSSDDTEVVLQCENDRSDSSGDSNLKQVTFKIPSL